MPVKTRSASPHGRQECAVKKSKGCQDACEYGSDCTQGPVAAQPDDRHLPTDDCDGVGWSPPPTDAIAEPTVVKWMSTISCTSGP